MKGKLSQLSVAPLPAKRPVDWLDVDGLLLWRFPSGTEAGDFLGVTSSSISQCIRGKTRTAGGAVLKVVGSGVFINLPLLSSHLNRIHLYRPF